jgi:hypothetical protein
MLRFLTNSCLGDIKKYTRVLGVTVCFRPCVAIYKGLSLKGSAVENYGFSDFDDHGTLRVSLPMWLWILYSLRHAILWLGLSISRSPDMLEELTDETHWAFMLCGVPALLLLLDAGFRVADAGRVPRWIWRNGRSLLVAAFLLHVVIAVAIGLTKPSWQFSISQVVVFVLDVLGLRFALNSSRVRDVFADFPEPNPVAKKAPTNRQVAQNAEKPNP